MSKRYSGIGSRKIVPDIKTRQVRIGALLASLGYTLISGGASGSDSAFEEGCDSVNGSKRIFLPHKGFNGHDSEYYVENWVFREEAAKLAKSFYGNSWNHITPFAKAAHTRNVAQILGWDLQTPVEFGFCYTDNGKPKGGTAQAIKVAKHYNIPMYNLFQPDIESWLKFL